MKYRCLLNIPHTFIFRDGYPVKALCTDESGYITRLTMESVDLMERAVSDRGLHGESNKLLRACRKLLLDFSMINDYTHAQENMEDPILCNVSGRLMCFSQRVCVGHDTIYSSIVVVLRTRLLVFNAIVFMIQFFQLFPIHPIHSGILH